MFIILENTSFFAIKDKLILLGIVLMIIRVHIHFLSQLNNGVLLRKWKHFVNESVGIFSTLILKYPC